MISADYHYDSIFDLKQDLIRLLILTISRG